MKEQNQKELAVAIAVLGVIFVFLAIPQAQSLICSSSGFLCAAVETEDISLRFFVRDTNIDPNFSEYLIHSEPSQSERKYDTRFKLSEAQYIYFDLSFRHRSVRLYSDFTIKPVCFFSSPALNTRRRVDCRIQKISLDSTDEENTIDPKENVFQKIALLDFDNDIGSDRRGNCQVIVEIGGEGEAINFKEVIREFSIF